MTNYQRHEEKVITSLWALWISIFLCWSHVGSYKTSKSNVRASSCNHRCAVNIWHERLCVSLCLFSAVLQMGFTLAVSEVSLENTQLVVWMGDRGVVMVFSYQRKPNSDASSQHLPVYHKQQTLPWTWALYWCNASESTGRCERKMAVICELHKMRSSTAQGNMEISPIFYPSRTGKSWLEWKQTDVLVHCDGGDNGDFTTKPKLVSLAPSARLCGVPVKPVLLPFGWHPHIL